MAIAAPTSVPDLVRRAQRLQLLTIVWTTAEAIIALGAPWTARSPALLGFAGDSAIEFAFSDRVLACMDARLVLSQILGTGIGDMHMIRNAGGIVTEDALRSPIISHHLLGTREFIIINHTDCGMLTFKNDDLLARLQNETGTAIFAPNHFHAFGNVEENVRRQIQKVL